MVTKNLVIVESGVKAKTISKYLNKDEISKKFGKFDVVASNGHITDLVKKSKNTEFGIDTNKWEATYEIIKDKKKTIQNLREAIKKADIVYLAADMDREGEAIAWHIKELFNIKKYKRIVFNEITEKAIHNAIQNPKDIDYNVVDAQQGRRFLDRIVGFNLTGLLWKNFDTFSQMSAGRVQSVLLSIICDHEDKIKKFKSVSYWTVIGDFKLDKIPITDAKLYSDNNLQKFTDKKLLTNFMKKMMNANFQFDNNSTKISKKSESAPKPFITSTLQQEANSQLGFSSKKTMTVSQSLYEKGFITYMRTDSTTLSNDAMKMIYSFISDKFGKDYFIDNNNSNKSKSKNAQEAHEAIRPSNVNKNTDKLDNDQKKLYTLILNKTIASQMIPAIFEELNVVIKQNLNNDTFVGKSKSLISPGFKIIYDFKPEKSLKKSLENIKNVKTVHPISINGHNIWSQPPARFTESKVIKTLESNGVGRPSTYASILAKLFDRQFIEKTSITGEKKIYEDFLLNFKASKITVNKSEKPYFEQKNSIVPTKNGYTINSFLQKYFDKIINVDFTSNMEDSLDSISKSTKSLSAVMSPFYKSFKSVIEKIPIDKKQTIESHNKEFIIDGITYIVRNARYGPVIQNDKSFISLTQYLKDTDKKIEDIQKKDIALLKSLPKKIDKNRELHYGRYGFYIKFLNQDASLRVFKNKVVDILNEDYSDFQYKKKE